MQFWCPVSTGGWKVCQLMRADGEKGEGIRWIDEGVEEEERECLAFSLVNR